MALAQAPIQCLAAPALTVAVAAWAPEAELVVLALVQAVPAALVVPAVAAPASKR